MIYLNCAATSAQKPPCVREAVLQALESPGSSSRGASEQDLNAARAVFDARLAIADFLGATHPERVVFCANATQALNTALFGLLAPGDHVIATDYEHNSVLRPLNALATQGVTTSYIPVEPIGALWNSSALRVYSASYAPCGDKPRVKSHGRGATGA